MYYPKSTTQNDREASYLTTVATHNILPASLIRLKTHSDIGFPD